LVCADDGGQAFRGWCNTKLPDRPLRFDNLESEVGDGVVLTDLWELLSHKKVPGLNRKHGGRHFYKLNNVGLLLESLKASGLPIAGISRERAVPSSLKIFSHPERVCLPINLQTWWKEGCSQSSTFYGKSYSTPSLIVLCLAPLSTVLLIQVRHYFFDFLM
jgi:hypothetical protein